MRLLFLDIPVVFHPVVFHWPRWASNGVVALRAPWRCKHAAWRCHQKRPPGSDGLIARWRFVSPSGFAKNQVGEMMKFDEHIFQMGWFNHQLVKSWYSLRAIPQVWCLFIACVFFGVVFWILSEEFGVLKPRVADYTHTHQMGTTLTWNWFGIIRNPHTWLIFGSSSLHELRGFMAFRMLSGNHFFIPHTLKAQRKWRFEALKLWLL